MMINSEVIHTSPFSGNRIVVANTITGQYLKTNQSYFHAITDIICRSGSIEKFFEENSVDSQIKENLESLYKSLVNINCFINSNEETVPKADYDQIYIAVTNRCNLQCRHCCQGSNSKKKDELSTAEICGIIDAVCLLNPKGIIFSGGEPLVRNDMVHILQYTKRKYQGQVILSTNALLINDENIDELLENITGVSISIDGYNEESCSIIRGPGIFNNVIGAMELLKKKGFHNISLSAVYTKYMENYEEEFRSLCQKYDAVPMLRNLFFEGRADLNEQELIPTDYIARLVEERGLSCRHCRAGEREMFIDSKANVFPCPLLQSEEFKCGNLLEDKCFKEFVSGEIGNAARKKMQIYRTWNNEECKNCEIGLFCQTCEAEYKMLRENTGLLKKFCHEKQKLKSLI